MSLLAATLALALGASSATPATPQEVKVLHESAFVYEEPKADSLALRRLYPGEVVTATREVVAEDASRWLEIRLGESGVGYLRADRVGTPTTLPVKDWAGSKVVRDDRPLVLGARVGGETLGAGLNLRYQPFSRLGLSLTAGGVMEIDESFHWRGADSTAVSCCGTSAR